MAKILNVQFRDTVRDDDVLLEVDFESQHCFKPGQIVTLKIDGVEHPNYTIRLRLGETYLATKTRPKKLHLLLKAIAPTEQSRQALLKLVKNDLHRY